jgi:PleD family two-component response regulator
LKRVLDRLGPLEVEHRGQKIPVTFAAGWTQMESEDSAETIIERADQILYADKRSLRKGDRAFSKAV